MPQTIALKALGLYDQASELTVPEGALGIADNVVIDRQDIVESRRGFEFYATGASGSVLKTFSYQSSILTHQANNKLSFWNGSVFSDYTPSILAPSGVQMQSTEANSNFYFTTSNGVYKLDSTAATPALAGMFKGLDIGININISSTGFMVDDTSVGYRVLFYKKDANGNSIYGSPSGRFTYSNVTGSAVNTVLYFALPQGIDDTHFYQMYRTAVMPGAYNDPGDECALVLETQLTSANVAAGFISVDDITPDSLRGTSLYTNASQEGILQSNERPPLAKDVATFKNITFYANTVSLQRLYFTLLSASNMVLGSTITINGVTFVAGNTENATINYFHLIQTGTVSQNIIETAQSLVRVINANASVGVYCFYLSSNSDLPGKMLLEARGLATSAFNVTVSVPVLWSLNGGSSAADTWLNGLFYSKSLQPEAVPLTNYFRVGLASKAILRIIPLRNALFILKEDGIFTITGEDSTTFFLLPFDSSCNLIAPETAVVMDNVIYALTIQGIVAISETGVAVKSNNIRASIDATTTTPNLTTTKSLAFAIPWQSDRKVLFFFPSGPGSTYCTEAFVLNTIYNTWTRWTLNVKCGLYFDGDGHLILSHGTTSSLLADRNNADYTDYLDETYSTTIITMPTATTLTVSTPLGIGEGDLIKQGDNYAKIVKISSGNIVTVDTPSLSTGAATYAKAIPCKVEWAPQSAGNPFALKQFAEAQLQFKYSNFNTAYFGFYTDVSQGPIETAFSGVNSRLWGLFQWGSSVWGGVSKPKPFRTYVPLEKSMGVLMYPSFRMQEAWATFQLEGLSLTITGSQSERTTR